MVKLELSRAHTRARLASESVNLYRDRPVMLTISTSLVVGTVDGRGYDGRQKDAICDVRGPCLTIWSTFKPVCRWFRPIGHAYELHAQVPRSRCRDLAIFVVITDGQMDNYRIARNFGGELNLAVWRSMLAPAKLKSANISYIHIYVWRSFTEPPNLNPPIFLPRAHAQG